MTSRVLIGRTMSVRVTDAWLHYKIGDRVGVRLNGEDAEGLIIKVRDDTVDLQLYAPKDELAQAVLEAAAKQFCAEAHNTKKARARTREQKRSWRSDMLKLSRRS